MSKKQEEKHHETGFALAKENYILLVIGFVIIIIGFMLMMGGKSADPSVFNKDELFSFRRITLAPIIVFFGFGFEIWAIMKKPKAEQNN
jgi:cytochrome bd-type quinol oxidase subunit 2